MIILLGLFAFAYTYPPLWTFGTLFPLLQRVLSVLGSLRSTRCITALSLSLPHGGEQVCPWNNHFVSNHQLCEAGSNLNTVLKTQPFFLETVKTFFIMA